MKKSDWVAPRVFRCALYLTATMTGTRAMALSQYALVDLGLSVGIRQPLATRVPLEPGAAATACAERVVDGLSGTDGVSVEAHTPSMSAARRQAAKLSA